MRVLLGLIIGAILFAVATVAAAPLFVSENALRALVTEAAAKRTGRTLTISGKTRFTLFPKVTIHASDVALSNPPGEGDEPFAVAKGLIIELNPWPLLLGRIVVTSYRLEGSTFKLKRSQAGSVNWRLSSVSEGPATLPPSRIEISAGNVIYTNARSGTEYMFGDINGVITLDSKTRSGKTSNSKMGALSLAGSFHWSQDRISLDATITPARAAFTENPFELTAEIAAPKLTLRYSGRVARGDSWIFDGMLDAKTPNLRSLALWADRPLGPGRGVQSAAVSGKINTEDAQIKFTDGNFALDGMTGKGNMMLDFSSDRPNVKAQLALDRLDLTPYLGPPPADADNGWRAEPVDFAGLKIADGELELKAHAIRYRRVTTGPATVNLTLRNGLMTAIVQNLALYNGNGSGSLTLDGTDQRQIVRLRGKLTQIDGQALLKDAANISWIEGKGDFDFDLVSRGLSQKAFMDHLSGRFAARFNDGQLRGLALDRMTHDVARRILDGWPLAKAQTTGYRNFAASFAVVRGSAATQDLTIDSPGFRLAGTGTISMPAQALELKVSPQLVRPSDGEASQPNALGFNVPIIVKGPWSKPKIHPGIDGILEKPAEAFKNVALKPVAPTARFEQLIRDVTKPKPEPQPVKADKNPAVPVSPAAPAPSEPTAPQQSATPLDKPVSAPDQTARNQQAFIPPKPQVKPPPPRQPSPPAATVREPDPPPRTLQDLIRPLP